MKYKMIIYDCDGVIFNSEQANFHYYNYIFKNFNLPEIKENDEQSINVLHTFCNDEVLKYFIKNEALLKEVIKFSRKVDYKIFYKFMKIEESFFETCKKLKEMGLKIAVATNRSYTFKDIVKYFKLYTILDDYVTTLEVTEPKPSPEMLFILLKRNKIEIEEALFIGDSILDYKAAKEAGINFIGYKFNINQCKSLNSHIEIFNYLL